MAIRQLKGAKNAQTPAISLTKRDPALAAAVSKMTTSPREVGRDSRTGATSLQTNTYAFRALLQRRARRNSDAAQIMRLLPDNELSAQILVSSILSPKDMSSIELNYQGPQNLFAPSLLSSMIDRVKEHFENDFKIRDKITEMVREPLFEKGSYSMAVIPENAIDDFINGDKMVSLEALADVVDAEGKVRPIGILGPSVSAKPTSVKGVVMESHFAGIKALDRAKIEAFEARVNYEPQTPTEQRERWEGSAMEDYLQVTDNPCVLKFPKLNQALKAAAVKAQYSRMGFAPAMENYEERARQVDGQVDDIRLRRAITPHRQFQTEPVALFKKPSDLKRKSVGAPLWMKLPSESVIPVHVPGNVKEHVGYFVVLDEEGHPLEVPDGEEYYNNQAGSSSQGSSLTSNLIRRVEMNLGSQNSFDPNQRAHLDFASRLYGELVERDLIARVKNGAYASGVELAKNEDIYRIMLSRVLAKKFTQILYIPSEFMTYIAFKYDDDGIGRSLLDETATLNMLRATTLFSDVMGGLRNSLGRTKVSATLPDKDPNPMKTIERMQDTIVRSRQLNMPLGVASVSDIFEFVSRAGYEWEFNGHPGIPDLKMEFEQIQSSYQKGDSDLSDLLRKSTIMAYGLTPEMVDNAYNSEFAATVLTNNVLLTRRVMLLQQQFSPQLSSLMRKLIANNPNVVDDLVQLLTEKKSDIKLELDESDERANSLSAEVKDRLLIRQGLQEFIKGFEVQLPQPTSVTLETQMQELDDYISAVDKGLDMYISNDILNEATAGQFESAAAPIKNNIKAALVRKWMAEKGMLTELGNLTSTDEEGKPVLNLAEEMQTHIKGLLHSGVHLLANLKPMIDATNKDMATVKPNETDVEPYDAGTTDSGSSSGGSDFGGGGGFDDFGGGFDMGGGMDFGPDLGGGSDAGGGDDLTIPSDEEAQANGQAGENPEDNPPV